MLRLHKQQCSTVVNADTAPCSSALSHLTGEETETAVERATRSQLRSCDLAEPVRQASRSWATNEIPYERSCHAPAWQRDVADHKSRPRRLTVTNKAIHPSGTKVKTAYGTLTDTKLGPSRKCSEAQQTARHSMAAISLSGPSCSLLKGESQAAEDCGTIVLVKFVA